MPNFEFDEDDHVYTLDGVVIPSVTFILTMLGYIDPTWFTEKACIRGEKVHKACAMIERHGDTDWDVLKAIEDQLETPVVPYVRGYVRFKKETGWVSTRTEVPRYYSGGLYAGTPDGEGRFPDSRSDEGLELKTGVDASWWELQEDGYGGLTNFLKWTTVRLTLGDFVLETPKRLYDGTEFIPLAKAYRTGRKHGLYTI